MFAGSQGPYHPAPGENYTVEPGVTINHPHPSGFINEIPQGDFVPRFTGEYLDQGVNTATSTSPSGGDPSFGQVEGLGGFRDSSEERLGGPGHGQAGGPGHYTGYNGFLPSPPDAEPEHGLATPAISPRQTINAGPPQMMVSAAATKQRASDKRKRRRHSTPTPSDMISPVQIRRPSAPGGTEKRRPTTQLRTASRAPKTYSASTARKAPESKEEEAARAAHNQVEQQYRKRLNTQFEKLLSVLPAQDDEEPMDEEGGGGHGGGGAGPRSTPGSDNTGKRISKAEVLDMARKRIRELEKDNMLLMDENRELRDERTHIQQSYTSRSFSGAVPKIESN
jgi:hypothetical protein